MHILTFLSPAILGAALASAQWYSASTTYELSLSCSTAYGPTWVHPIPTDYSRFSTTISSSYPLATQLDTVYVTADTTATVPTTSYFYETTIYTVRQDRTTTYTHVIPSTATIATITNPTTVCTNDVTPTATVTSYTGTPYTPIPGQNTVLPSTWEDSIFCNVYDIAIEHIWPTVQGTGQTTTTITPSVTDRNSVVRTTITYIWTTSIPVATTVITARSYDVAYTSPTISTASLDADPRRVWNAIKLTYVRHDPEPLRDEKETYEALSGGMGIPRVRWFGQECDFYALVHDILGPSLEDLFNYCGRIFSLKTILLIADQAISRIEYIHSKGFLHRDIKPDNFLMGIGR
ncbi:hypothetical protein GE09DRAFT_1228812 [Coniochaeta sp. 2T2.1]|nr:hypothetical protein GE09DRAFT_1228812 [Coniochaeta sp. 2T2.1]